MVKTLKPIALLLLISASAQFSLAQQCVDLFSNKKEPRLEKIEDSEKLVQIRQQLNTLLESTSFKHVFNGRQKPSWQDYNALVQIQKLILGNDSVKRIKYLNTEEKIILQAGLKEPLEIAKTQIDSQLRSADYKKFLDDHYAWFKMLERINEIAGIELLPTANLSVLRSNEKLTKDAEKIIQDLEANFKDTFKSSGHENFEEFKKYTRDFSPDMRRKMDVVEKGLVVGMHRPESARFWIPITGFQNQRITGSSNGRMDPELRDRAEANLIEQPFEKYSPLSARLKPNYAEARPHMTNTTDTAITNAIHYGSDIWVFKNKSIESRSTWSPKDSLSPGSYSGSNTWSSHFIPWKYKALMTPYWKDSNFRPTTISTVFKLEITDSNRWTRSGSSYFEVQVWGPSTIDDIQAFIFKKNPPDKEFYQYLVSKNIEVWDERKWPAKKYTGDESK